LALDTASAAPPGASLDQVQALYVQTPASLVGNLTGMAVVVWMFGPFAPMLALAWCGVLVALLLVRLVHYRRYPRGVVLPPLLAWRNRWNAYALLSALCWGVAVWLFYGLGTHFHTIALILIVYAYSLGAAQLLARQWRVYLVFLSLGLVPMIVRVASDTGEPYHWQLALTMTLLFLATVLLARTYNRAFERTIELKQRTEQLLAQLRVEKAAAEAARGAAEVANRAKTQFFAAASHDLRQPLHALGLFAEALRARSHDGEVAQLVNSINASVDALEGLFSELLDITRIDTGGVEVKPQHFALGDLFRKLRLHFEPTAFEKGLDLRFRGQHHFAHADPLLVERVLRNLVSNAIRYTEDGSVLVSARRHGDKVLLQVWDTGPGIREQDQERIFEEFFQVPDAAGAALDPHQRKGLGLGLAIVKRLAGLMEAPLRLRSRPGHGTVFTLEVPVGREQRAPEAAGKPRSALGLTLDRRLIVIVEDDPAVRGGLEVLLKSWGASVLSFDSVAACLGWSRAVDPAQPVPDLLIVDYRLESGHTGVEAIAGLRQRFGVPLPALVVTGSMMSGFEQDAQEHDFHLLLKPVVPHKLRAMIAFKLGLR
jgi:signal transduction histidine kinase